MTTAPEPAPADPGPPTNYLDLYGLSKAPFGGPSQTSGYILFGSHRRAFELLVDHLMKGSGLILLTGDEGVGKTQTMRAAAAVAAESGLRAIMVDRPQDGRITLDQLLAALDGQPDSFHNTERKALLADDIELMPNDCISLLLSLVRAKPESGGSAIVLTRSATDLIRPDLTELSGLAVNTLRLSRLGPAEIRQYIERSLWVSGGTTRRLLTPDTMKLLTVRSAGLPGSVNRMMEAVLTAGFARGETMITARTVAAALGPAAPRPRTGPRSFAPRAEPSNAVQFIAMGLLAIGVAAFLYKGLTGLKQSPPQSPGPAATAAPRAVQAPPPASVPPVKPAPQPRQPETLPPDLMAALMKRGNQSLELGDISAARLLFQRAARAGNAAAATALAKTFDPNFMATESARDPDRAAAWYQEAIDLGDPSAADLLKRVRRQ